MTPRIDSERVAKHLLDISSTLRVLEGLKDVSFDDYAADPITYWAVEKGLERCIQNVLDVGAHVLAAVQAPVPENYQELLVALGRHGILPVEFANRISKMAGFRNILVHQYLDIDQKLVYDVLQSRLDDFRDFADHLLFFMKGVSESEGGPGY